MNRSGGTDTNKKIYLANFQKNLQNKSLILGGFRQARHLPDSAAPVHEIKWPITNKNVIFFFFSILGI